MVLALDWRHKRGVTEQPQSMALAVLLADMEHTLPLRAVVVGGHQGRSPRELTGEVPGTGSKKRPFFFKL